MPDLRLISFHTCPYVQRAAFVLEAKGVDYEIQYIDLANKPDWFLALSPLGKVPLLQVDGDEVLFESQVIAEYIEETQTPRMHPESALRRAKHRAYIELISAALVPAWRLTTVKTKEEVDTVAAALRRLLERLEQAHSGKTFFDGKTVSLVDAAAGPLLQRIAWAQEFAPLGLFAELPKLTAWHKALLRTPALQASAVPDLRERSVAAYTGWLGDKSKRDATGADHDA
ncbi:MAG: glutathione S-transferase family protein [Nannocystaceae bacterium]|nr:glutathione S-transferase family protein [Nannocystaceae bacterium]